MLPHRFRFCAFLALTALAACQAPTTSVPPPKDYAVTDQGAQGDGVTLNTAAIQATIDRCSAAGGGVVVVPKGVFLTGALFLKQGVNLRVDQAGFSRDRTACGTTCRRERPRTSAASSPSP